MGDSLWLCVYVYRSAVELQVDAPGNVVGRVFDGDGVFDIIQGFEVVENARRDADGDEVTAGGKFRHYPVEINAVFLVGLHRPKRVIFTGGVRAEDGLPLF